MMATAREDDSDDDFYIAPFIEEPYDPNKKPMYAKHLVYCNGQEYSLEEIRARRYMKDITNTVPPKVKQHTTIEDALLDKENHPGLLTKSAGVMADILPESNLSKHCLVPPKVKQHTIEDALLDKENNPSLLTKSARVMADILPASSMPKHCIVPPKFKQHATIDDALLDKENSPSLLSKGAGMMADILPASIMPKHCKVSPGDKQQHATVDDALLDKENNPCFLTKSAGVIEDMIPVSEMQKLSIDKTFTKFENAEDVSNFDVFMKPSSNFDLDVTSYTKAFSMPAAISTPGFGSGKLHNLKGSGSESRVKKCNTEKPNDVDEPKSSNSDLSVIEENSREYNSASSGANSAATLATMASEIQNPIPAINSLHCDSVNGNSSRIPTMLGGGTAEVSSRSQVTRIPCSINRGKVRSTAIGDLFKDSTSGQNTTEQNENIDIKSNSITFRNNNKSSVCASMDEICRQMEEMVIALDPFEQCQIDDFLKNLRVPVSDRIGYYLTPQKLPVLKANLDFHLRKEARDGGHLFKSLKVIGQGSYAKVYKAYTTKWKKMVALKIQKPACHWEFYISHEINSRITDHLMKNSFMNVKEASFFNDGSILISDFMEYGTLLDVINLFKIRRMRIPEALAVYFTLEILRIINVLHSIKIIHADIKPDNFLLRKLPQTNEDFTLFGQTTLQLIDLGRCIDMSLYPPNACFNTVFQKTFFQCVEMRSKKQWTYQVDMFHIASLVHVMIVGDFMDVIYKGGVWNITKKIPRNLNQDLWNWFFNLMLNIESCTKLPDLSEVIKKIEKVFLNSMIQDIVPAVAALRKFFNEDKANVK